MSFRVISRQVVKQLLDITTSIELVEYAHKQLRMGNAEQPLRSAIWPEQAKGILATMPAYVGGKKEVMGLKAVTVFPGNHELGLESHQGAIILMNPKNGLLHAVLDAAEITALRTAAASAVATKYLVREDATSLSLIGAGVQAHSHLRAMDDVLRLEEIRIWNRTENRTEEFVSQYSDQYPVIATPNLEDALSSDVICTLTAAKDPLFDINDVTPGVHINAVGASQAYARELGPGFASNASWFTDVYESAMNEAGVLLIPQEEGTIEELPEVIELGALVTKDHPGRKSSQEITVYKSLGVGIQDLICAKHVLSQAEEQDVGSIVEF